MLETDIVEVPSLNLNFKTGYFEQYFSVCNLLSVSPASDYCWMPTFRNTICSIFRGWLWSVKYGRLEEDPIFILGTRFTQVGGTSGKGGSHYLLPPFPLVPPPWVNLVPGINIGPSSSLPYFTLHVQPLEMEQIKCSETSAFNNNQTLGKYPKDYTQYSKHGESLKSRVFFCFSFVPIGKC